MIRRRKGMLLLAGGLAFVACGEPPDREPSGQLDVTVLERRVPVEGLRLGGADAPEEQLFSRPPPVAVGPHGTLLVLLRSVAEVRRYGTDGTLLNRIGRSGEGPGEFRNPFVFGLVGDTVWLRNLSPPFEGLNLGTSLPPIRSLLAGLDGTVWLERVSGLSGTEWVVLDSDARPLFKVDLPEGQRLRAGSRESMWTTWTDSLDVPYVTRHDLVP